MAMRNISYFADLHTDMLIGFRVRGFGFGVSGWEVRGDW